MIKWVKRNEINIRNEKLAEAVLDKCNSSLWSEVKKIKGPANYVPCNIDNVSGDGNISNLLAKKFSDLYNSVGYSDEEMMEIEGDIKSKINSNFICKTAMCIHQDGYVSVSDIQNAIKCLKSAKKM